MGENVKYQFYKNSTEAWDAMYEAILAAQKSIYWEVYIFVDDEVGRKFINALKTKAEQGLDVKLVIDAIGSYNFSTDAEKELRASRIELFKYNPLHPSVNIFKWGWRVMSRNHRKVLIVDEKYAFLGGVNIKNEHKDWHDVYVRLQGKVVRPLLRAFAKSYISAGGKKEKVKHLLQLKRNEWRRWRNKFKFLIHSPKFLGSSKTTQWYVRALAMADESVHLVTPYFVPDKRFLRALARARARGVKVNLYLPLRPDHKAMELLARWYYTLAERAGATIYFLPSMSHGKAVSVDNKIGMVGSSNITPRSSWLNAEAGIVFEDEDMVRELNKIFNGLQSAATPYAQVDLPKLGPIERFQQWVLTKIQDYF